MNTVVALAAPIVTLIGSIAALFGVWLTQTNNLKIKEMELDHNRKLKLLELREESARIIRNEKREAYVQALKASRVAVGHEVFEGQMSLGQQLVVNVERLDEASTRFQELIPELELVSSQMVHRLFHEVYLATARCKDRTHHLHARLRGENEHLLDPNRVPQEEAWTTAQAIWEQVQAEAQKAFDEERVLERYNEFRNQVRTELGEMALDPKLVPTSEELEALRREIHTL